MTRKDYELIASGIREVVFSMPRIPSNTTTAISQVAEVLATLLERDNPRFDRQVFLAACGLSNHSVSEVKHAKRVNTRLRK